MSKRFPENRGSVTIPGEDTQNFEYEDLFAGFVNQAGNEKTDDKEKVVEEQPKEVNAEVVAEENSKETPAAEKKEKEIIPKTEKVVEKKAKPITPVKPSKEKETTPSGERRGRKKKYEEERDKPTFLCGMRIYELIKENAFFERKKMGPYICDLIDREIEAYEKDKEHYIETRRRRVENALKKENGAAKSISFTISKKGSFFLDDIQFDLRCNKVDFFRAIIDADAERIEKKKAKGN